MKQQTKNTHSNQTYRDKIFGFLLTFDGELLLTEMVAPENRAEFIALCKEFDRINRIGSTCLEFSDDYTKLRTLKKINLNTIDPQTRKYT